MNLTILFYGSLIQLEYGRTEFQTKKNFDATNLPPYTVLNYQVPSTNRIAGFSLQEVFKLYGVFWKIQSYHQETGYRDTVW